jgi:hypothetical protein
VERATDPYVLLGSLVHDGAVVTSIGGFGCNEGKRREEEKKTASERELLTYCPLSKRKRYTTWQIAILIETFCNSGRPLHRLRAVYPLLVDY